MKLLLAFCLFLLQTLLFADKNQSSTDDDEPTFAEDLFRKREFDFGIRGGLGYKPEDRFESDLKNYKTISSPNEFSTARLSSFRKTTNNEFFARIRLFSHSKFGFVFGSNYFQNFNITEASSAGYYSKLDFKLSTDFFFLTYHHIFPFRRFFIETGLGLGVNTVTWQTSGVSLSRFGYYNQDGFMVGNGLGYRMDTSINRQISNNFVLQLGLMYNYHTVPSFNGSFNDSFGSFYVRSDGTVAPILNSEVQNSAFETSYASRKLDMRVGNAVVYFGVVFRFSL